jgi:hypothetical protein
VCVLGGGGSVQVHAAKALEWVHEQEVHKAAQTRCCYNKAVLVGLAEALQQRAAEVQPVRHLLGSHVTSVALTCHCLCNLAQVAELAEAS